MDPTGRRLDAQERFYERFADRFDAAMDRYDLARRLWVVFDVLLAGEDLTGRRLLDAGCGTGWFSQAAAERGARVTSLDVGPDLLAQVARKCATQRVIGDLSALAVADGAYDYVVASDVIEHTARPEAAIRELLRVLRPGGLAAVTVPNRVWKPAQWLANGLGLRAYQGHEHWLGPVQLVRRVRAMGGIVEHRRGLHLVPFVWKRTHGLLRRLDRAGPWLYPVCVNLCLRVRKPAARG